MMRQANLTYDNTVKKCVTYLELNTVFKPKINDQARDLRKDNPLLDQTELDKRSTFEEIIQEYPIVKDHRKLINKHHSTQQRVYLEKED